jgi:hypothetical protein
MRKHERVFVNSQVTAPQKSKAMQIAEAIVAHHSKKAERGYSDDGLVASVNGGLHIANVGRQFLRDAMEKSDAEGS